jgi:phage FluMu protein Com
MCGPNISRTITCANCGAAAQVVISLNDQGEAHVVTRTEGRSYVSVDCPYCGRVQQEIGDLAGKPRPPGLRLTRSERSP